MTIFVSIAAYRDPLLVPTVKDCVAKARYPEDLRFGICWQRDPEDERLEVAGDDRFRVIEVDWRQSRGVCWARSEIMRLYDDEDFYLQLDSHHRFVKDWDVKLLRLAEDTGSRKPILTAYGPPLDLDEDDPQGLIPGQLNFVKWVGHVPIFQRAGIPGWERLDRPVRARSMSGHFSFTVGRFVEEIPYDPELFFTGEEIVMTVRAFTHGYDLFHPLETIVWHKWSRKYRRTHWQDHVGEVVETPWSERESSSRARVERFLTAPWVGPFGCGTERSFADYERYAGLDFKKCRTQDYTRRQGEPPNPPCAENWAEEDSSWRIRILANRARLDPAALVNPVAWKVSVADSRGDCIYGGEVAGDELAALVAAGDARLLIDLEFESARDPDTWTISPQMKDGSLTEAMTGLIGRSDDAGTAVVL